MAQNNKIHIPVVEVVDGKKRVSSLDVAKSFEKKHSVIMRDIRQFFAKAPKDFVAKNFEMVQYDDAKGETHHRYLMSLQGFIILATSYSGDRAMQVKLVYVEAFGAEHTEQADSVCQTQAEQRTGEETMGTVVNSDEVMGTEHTKMVKMVNGKPATSSLEVAKFFGKPHKDVLRSIRTLMDNCSESFNGRNFSPVEYSDAKGETRLMYTLHRDGFMLLVMGYTGKEALKIKLGYIEAFNAMEAELMTRRTAELPPAQTLEEIMAEWDTEKRGAETTAFTFPQIDDLKPLFWLVGMWASIEGLTEDEAWKQVRDKFAVVSGGFVQLPEQRLVAALAYVQAQIDRAAERVDEAGAKHLAFLKLARQISFLTQQVKTLAEQVEEQNKKYDKLDQQYNELAKTVDSQRQWMNQFVENMQVLTPVIQKHDDLLVIFCRDFNTLESNVTRLRFRMSLASIKIEKLQGHRHDTSIPMTTRLFSA